MKVKLEQRGGIAAGVRLPPLTVDEDTLPAAARGELARLVAAVRGSPSRTGKGKAVADAMTYTITADEGGDADVFRQTDAGMTAAFAELLTWLERHRGESAHG